MPPENHYTISFIIHDKLLFFIAFVYKFSWKLSFKIFTNIKRLFIKRDKQEHRMRYQRSSVGAIILLKIKLKRGITPKLQLSELCPLSCHCILSWWASIPSLVLTLSNFWVMGYIKVFARRRRWQWPRRSSDHNSSTFSSKQTS